MTEGGDVIVRQKLLSKIPAHELKSTMSSVQVYHRNANDEDTFVACIDDDLIKRRSKTIHDLIATRSPALIHKVTLFGPTIEALAFVLNQITEAHDKKKPLDITLGRQPWPSRVLAHPPCEFSASKSSPSSSKSPPSSDREITQIIRPATGRLRLY